MTPPTYFSAYCKRKKSYMVNNKIRQHNKISKQQTWVADGDRSRSKDD